MSLRLLRLAQHLRASPSHALAKPSSLTASARHPTRLYTASSAALRPTMSDEAEKAKLVR